MSVDSSASSRLLVGIGVLSVPALVFLLGAAVELFMPRSAFLERQWLVNGMSMALAYGGLASLVCTPLAVGMAYFNFRQLTPRDRIAAGTLIAVSLSPLILGALYLFLLSQMG